MNINLQSIRTKSSIPVVVMGLTIIVVIALFLWMMAKQNHAIELQTELFMPANEKILNADRDLHQAKIAAINVMANRGNRDEEVAVWQENAKQAYERYEQFLSYVQIYPDVAAGRDAFEAAYNQWMIAAEKMVNDTNSSNERQLAQQEEETFQSLRSILDNKGEVLLNKFDALDAQLKSELKRSMSITIIVVLAIIIVALYFSYTVPKKLTSDINDLIKRIDMIASGDGDLTARLDVNSKDEFGELAQSFNRFVEKLQDLIKSTLDNVKGLSSLTVQLADSSNKTKSINETLNLSTESIVSAVHEMTLANKEMSNVATNSASEADQTSQLAAKGIHVVEESNKCISELIKDMDTVLNCSEQLEQNSTSILSVLEVISSVAEQTNLLALNAAIEAARAGDHGRGFAVVADEVRSLATRTQQSTDDISQIISQLQSSVSQSSTAITQGKTDVDKTANTFQEASSVFDEIRASSRRVNDMAIQTAAATEEQTAVAEDISKNLHGLNQQTESAQQVSKTGDEISKKITNFSENMMNLMGRFKV
ncbi:MULTISPECIES: methyl-accepting chemotaxis protein [unclassified Methylophaga]|uniref:methyl-accepting chemotaxis protein n=2 Tax=Methylophaga TaxID=40222 RepID=UPI000C5B1EF5|nr:methyl-accepting chemotaxis protein [Methylophaga sp. UBA678]MAX50881.1 methyl-accepting chemotaxis protein [Methylophaga sp.]|tara:strand:+ start:73359 stop:74975 length:1617 start_codon:yes stop_codon:yes gene_type:complete